MIQTGIYDSVPIYYRDSHTMLLSLFEILFGYGSWRPVASLHQKAAKAAKAAEAAEATKVVEAANHDSRFVLRTMEICLVSLTRTPVASVEAAKAKKVGAINIFVDM